MTETARISGVQDPLLRVALERVSAELWGGADVEIAPMSGGMTNQNFVARPGGAQVMVHVQLPDHLSARVGIDRDRQVVANTLAADLGVAPRLLLVLAEPRVLVTEYVPGGCATAETLRQPERIRQVAALLRRFHDAPAQAELQCWVSEPFTGLREFQRLAVTASATRAAQFDAVLAVSDDIEHVLPAWTPALTHIDLSPANLVGSDELQLIDWEYAGLGDPMMDVADFAVKSEFDVPQIETLLQAYQGSASAADVAVVRLYGIVTMLREALWALAMTDLPFHGFDHAAYARAIGDDLNRVIALPWVAESLDVLRTRSLRAALPQREALAS